MKTTSRRKILDGLAYEISRERKEYVAVDTFQEFILHYSKEAVELLVEIAMGEYLLSNLPK